MKKTLSIVPFDGLTWLQTAEYVLITIALAILPVSLNLTVYTGYAAVVMAVVRMIIDRPPLRKSITIRSRMVRWCLYSMIALWGIYAISLSFTENLEAGLLRVFKLLPMLIFGLYFLLADHTIFTRQRVRNSLWGATSVMVVIFLVSLVIMLYRIIFEGITFSQLTSKGFYNLHHSYMAYYLLTAIGFVYSEVIRLWHSAPKWQRWAMIATEACLAAFVVLANSRAGILGLGMVVLLIIVHLVFFCHRWRAAIALIATVVALTAATVAILPSSQHRISNTVLSSGQSNTDARVNIYSIALEAVSKQPLGYGAGDYVDELSKLYASHGFDSYADVHYNSHNQYLDTTLATGIGGLGILLLSFILFFIIAWRRRDVAAIIFILVTAESICFEAMFYRQYGVLFFCFVYGMLLVSSNNKNTAQIEP